MAVWATPVLLLLISAVDGYPDRVYGSLAEAVADARVVQCSTEPVDENGDNTLGTDFFQGVVSGR